MSAPELASVDGRIAETSEARIPAADDGLLRGDGVFEVIRLYAGRPYRAGRAPRPPGALGGGDRAPDRAARLRGGDLRAARREFGEHEAQLRLVATRGGRRLAFTENLPPYADRESISVATVTYSPSEILNGVKSLSYAANMQAIPAGRGRAEPTRRSWSAPTGSSSRRPTSTIFWVRRRPAADAEPRGRHPRLDHPRPAGP